MSQKLFLYGLAVAVATAVACGSGDKNPNPVSPGGGGSVEAGDAGPGGETLKLTTPTPLTPANGSTLDTFAPVLSVTASTPKFQGSGPLTVTHRFQLLSGSTVVGETRTSRTTWTPSGMQPRTTYSWRARGEVGGMVGPWSASWTFTTAEQPEGYIRAGELYDPLIDGKSIGDPEGSVSFIPNVGARLNSLTSYIKYALPERITAGEFSMLVTGVLDNTEGSKTKLMSMCEAPCPPGNAPGNMTVNDRRFTLERRGNPRGIVAWRLVTHDDAIDTGPTERIYVPFSPNQTYLIRTVWGGNRLTITMHRGGANGQQIYRQSKSYLGVYDPTPHHAFVGGPMGRAGSDSGSVQGMIARQVWISRNPRPSFADK